MELGQMTFVRIVQGEEGFARLEGCVDVLAGRRLGKVFWKQEELSYIFREGCGVGRVFEDVGCVVYIVNFGMYLGVR